MNFQPRTEQEIADSALLRKGNYDFEIIDATEKKSAAGNEMIELKVRVSNGNGISRTLTDYLLGKRPARLRNCCAACGLEDKYETGCLSADDFPGKRGTLKVTIEKAKGFSARNIIQDYVPPASPAAMRGRVPLPLEGKVEQ
jgi:hypothetical protein